MGLVLYALKYRVSFFVLGVLMLLGGIGSALVTIKDVLPVVNIPVVVIVWTYTGLDTTDMASRITTYSEFGLTNNVNNIKQARKPDAAGHDGREGLFRPVRLDRPRDRPGRGSSVNSIRAVLPPGVQPPVVLRFSASSAAGHPARPHVGDAEWRGDVRLRAVPHPADADHRARRHAALAVRRLAASDPGRPRPARVAGQRP